MPMLTTRYRQLNSDSSRSDLDVIKWNSRGQALVKDAANLSDAGKLFMSPDDWVDGWKTWLWLAEKYQPDVAPAWHNHFAIVFYDPSFHSDFNLWLCYDIMVRKRWIDEDFDPGTFQEGIYKMVDRDLAMAARGSVSQPAPGDSSPPSSHHNQTTRFRTWGPVPGANNSYPYGHPKNPIASILINQQPHPTLLCPLSHLVNLINACVVAVPATSTGLPGYYLDVSATFSMAPKDVPPLDASAVPMSALSVASTATMHKIAQIDPRKIVTPLILQLGIRAWKASSSSTSSVMSQLV
ncbi:zinc finger protein [Rhizoctonia solani]|uniref:Zinc finger protein n=1 Tax=Rhizoctonia solani TaxID=456999 RepID=A0A8H7I1J2_9AGAM|nr:zinc finger protein [Rhizoctonia solani]